MSSDTAYLHEYYHRVLKPKRAALRAAGLTPQGRPRPVIQPKEKKALTPDEVARKKFAVRQQGIRWESRISYAEFNRMFDRQDRKCAICSEADAKRWTIDHDPVTHRVRGILCHRCNVGLGFYRDNPSILLSAARYIRKSKRVP